MRIKSWALERAERSKIRDSLDVLKEMLHVGSMLNCIQYLLLHYN